MSEASASHRYYLGTISGTSVDGLDIALLDLGNGIEFVASTVCPFPDDLTEVLLTLGQPGADDLDQVGEIDALLGEFIGDAITRFLADQNLSAADIVAIGSHGQTIRHRPLAANPFTWQIGDPNRIAEQTGIDTVADFRRRDMAAGGQGAPLVPTFHEALFRTSESRVIVNIGGIANLTRLPKDPGLQLSGFDTGPGNGLMDAWCLQKTGQPFDSDGAWAASGALNTALLQRLLSDEFLTRMPPKSTGREYFNLHWLNQHLQEEIPAEDVQRTLLEYTATTIQNAINSWAPDSERVIVCGGGRLNAFLMSRLAALGEAEVVPSEAHGYDGDAIEAAAFAWLAAQRLAHLPGNAALVTGARGFRVLGAIYPG